MEMEQVKEYVKKVRDNEKFRELLEFTRLMELKPGEDLYENIKYYLSRFHYRRDCEEWFQPDWEYFIRFLEHYLNGEPAENVLKESGYIDLSRTPHLIKPVCFIGNAGNFTDNHMIFTDGSKYISKMPLNQKGNSGVSNACCRYSALIASHIARTIGVEAPEFRIALAYNGIKILSKNALKPNDELIVYLNSIGENKISEQLRELEQALRLRGFSREEIDVAKLEFLKQEVVAKIIGLKDQTPENSSIIISVDGAGNKHVRIAPMFDLDYSFQIGEERRDLIVRKCDNGQEDIGSLIEQYKGYPGFEEFVKKSIQDLDMIQVFRNIYQSTGIKIFGNYEDNEQMQRFISFVNKNLRTCKRNY